MLIQTGSTDPALMRLSHPLRCASEDSEGIALLKSMLGPAVWENMAKAFDSPRLTGDVAADLCSRSENRRLRDFLMLSNQFPGSTEVGNSFATLLPIRQAMHPQPYFVLEDKLVEMLENTDISDDVTTGLLQVPYPRFFVEFGKERKCSLRIWNSLSGEHILEGAYIERGRNGEEIDGIFVVLTGSPLGKEHVTDDATHSFFLPLDNPDIPLRDALRGAFERGRKLSIEHNLRVAPDESFDLAIENLRFLLKALLYIGLPEARREVHKERTDWVKATSSLQSKAKRAKAEKRRRSLVDHIRICAPAPRVETEGQAGEGRAVKTHWRRGHFRQQAYGPQWSQRKLILVPWTLVNSYLGAAPAPTYKVS